MKILHVLVALNKAGTERLVLSLAKEQKKNGHQVKVLAFSNANHFTEMTEGLDVIFTTENKFINRVIRKPKKITDHFNKLLDEYEPDIVHTHSIWVDWVVHSCYRAEIKYFSHYHVYNKQYLPFNYSKNLKDELFRKIDHFKITNWYQNHGVKLIVVSKDMFEFYAKNSLRLSKNKVFLVNNGIDLSNYDLKPKKLSANKFRLITVGRLEKMKNISFLIEVANYLKEKKLNFQFDIFGKGSQRQEFNLLIEKYNLSNHIEIKGEIDNIHDVYRNYDIYLHASKEESFGLSILEAMSSGLPCVALDAGGNRDLIINGENGFILPKTTLAVKFASKVIESLDPERYSKFSNRSVETARGFSLERLVENVNKIYNSSE